MDPPVAQVLPWDPRIVDTSVLVQSGLLVANPERPKEYWCPCLRVCACSVVGLKLYAKRASRGGCWKVAGRGARRGSNAGRVCWKGAGEVLEGVSALKGSAGRVRWKGVPALEGVLARFQPGVPAQKGVRAGVLARVQVGIVSPVSTALHPLLGHCGCPAATGAAGRVGG